MNHEEKIFAKHLPDFVSKKVELKEASKQFKEALDKIAKEFGHDPKWETYLTDYKKYGGNFEGDMVGYEACPIHDWGVSYSLGAYPKSYNWQKNPQDWYLECHYGFDVIFKAKLKPVLIFL